MSETCGRCGRRLKDPFFREIGYGRTCAAKLGITLPRRRKGINSPPKCRRRTGQQMKMLKSLVAYAFGMLTKPAGTTYKWKGHAVNRFTYTYRTTKWLWAITRRGGEQP